MLKIETIDEKDVFKDTRYHFTWDTGEMYILKSVFDKLSKRKKNLIYKMGAGK